MFNKTYIYTLTINTQVRSAEIIKKELSDILFKYGFDYNIELVTSKPTNVSEEVETKQP